MRFGWYAYKFFTIFTGTKYDTLWLGSHNSRHLIYDLRQGYTLANLSMR